MAQLIKGKQISNQSVTINGSIGNVITTGDLDMNSYQILLVNSPTLDTHAANKAYVDAVAQGVIPHAPVRVVLTGQTTLSDVMTIDGVTLVETDRVLVAGQSNPVQNGIYVVHSGGTAWTRALDADGNPTTEVSLGDFTFVSSGVTNSNTGWVLGGTTSTGSTINVGIDTQIWFKMVAPGSYIGNNLSIVVSGNIINLIIDGDTLTQSVSGLKIATGYTTSIETLISSSVSTEASNRTSADSSLDTKISTSVSTEASLRTSADVSLATALSTQSSQGISVETSLRTSADSSLDTKISTSVSTEASLRTSADVSLATALSTQTSQRISVESSLRTSADASLSSAIDGLNSPTVYSENITPANSGSTSSIIVSTNAFVFPIGTVSLGSISVHLNGIQYNFNYTSGTGIIFYVSGTPSGGTPVTLYFDGTVAQFDIETTDEVNIKFTAIV